MTTDYPMTSQGVRNLDCPIVKTTCDVNVGEGERTASAIGGTVLAGIGMTRGGIGGWLLIAAGGALVYRGMSGHCLAYEAAGINTAEEGAPGQYIFSTRSQMHFPDLEVQPVVMDARLPSAQRAVPSFSGKDPSTVCGFCEKFNTMQDFSTRSEAAMA